MLDRTHHRGLNQDSRRLPDGRGVHTVRRICATLADNASQVSAGVIVLMTCSYLPKLAVRVADMLREPLPFFR